MQAKVEFQGERRDLESDRRLRAKLMWDTNMEVQECGVYQETDHLDAVLKYSKFEDQIEVLKALASDTRLKILKLLREKRTEPERGLDISTLAYLLGQTEANISAQCKRLEMVKLIKIEYKPGGHGVRKICQVDFGAIEFLFE